ESGGWRQLAMRTSALCAVDEGFAIHCTDPALAGTPTAGGSVVRVADAVACALDYGRVADCWGSGPLVAALPDVFAADLAMTDDSACVFDDDGGTIACFGDDTHGEVSGAPASSGFLSVAAGFDHFCALDGAGEPLCWGRDVHGETAAPGSPFLQLALGRHPSCGLAEDGAVACWGAGSPSSPNGTGDHYGQASPPAGSFTALAAGADFTCGRRADGTVDCWGRWTSTDARAGGDTPMEPPAL
ncbi:MAG TPA: hypothetical protein RMH26_26990, partial [Polyangiaceae bacterium LLY-WYZ-15_(1-7)]|nr:hypothetical protein [Polyangiaceae bacterium LLY-WYZ-15_(1-7)]